MDTQDNTNPLEALYPDHFSPQYKEAEKLIPQMTDFDLSGLAGALVAELVNRGNDTDSALEAIVLAAQGGADGSRAFDQMVS